MPKASVWEVCGTGFKTTSSWGLSRRSEIELPNEMVMDVADEPWDVEPEKAKAVMAEKSTE
jgi:hypothetical protein